MVSNIDEPKKTYDPYEVGESKPADEKEAGEVTSGRASGTPFAMLGRVAVIVLAVATILIAVVLIVYFAV